MQQGASFISFRINQNFISFHSIIKYLVNEFQIDPNTFLYDWKYDALEKYSLMSQAYIDLGNYLSGKMKFL